MVVRAYNPITRQAEADVQSQPELNIEFQSSPYIMKSCLKEQTKSVCGAGETCIRINAGSLHDHVTPSILTK